MTFDIAKQVFDQINETKLNSLSTDVLEYCIRYAGIRADWYLISKVERNSREDERTRAHNALIDALNVLSREMIKAGENAEWRKLLGNDRKEIGDFACYVHCLMGLSMR